MVRRISVHYYSSEIIKEKLLIEVIFPIVKKFHSMGIKSYIRREWKFGPHIEVIYENDGRINEKEIIEKLKLDVKKFQDINGYDEKFDKKAYAKVIKDTAKMEREKKYLPIQEQGYIFVDDYDIKKKSGEYTSINEKVCFEEYNFKIAPYIMELLEKMFRMNFKERIIYFGKCLAILATNYPKYGASKGYLSFVSHSEGFLGNKRRKTQIYRDRFKKFYDLYSSETEDEVRKLIFSYRDNTLKEYDELIFEMNEVFKDFINEIRHVIKEDKENSNKTWISYGKRKREVGRRFRGKSKFHTGLLNGDREFTSFIVSDDFNCYRLLVNFLYNQTPVIGFSASSRMLSCYMCYHAIEACYGESWEHKLGLV